MSSQKQHQAFGTRKSTNGLQTYASRGRPPPRHGDWLAHVDCIACAVISYDRIRAS